MQQQALNYTKAGAAAAFSICALVLLYDVVTVCGFFSLASADAPIADPYFLLMELLTIGISLLLVALFRAIHHSVPAQCKKQSLAALVFMILMAVTTSVVHLTILTYGRMIDAEKSQELSWLLSFTWPSVAYALDILAWDVFFPLAMLFAAVLLWKGSQRERRISLIMTASAVLSLLGLPGIPLNNMQVRNIGIIGYALVSPFAFLLLGIHFKKSRA